MMLERRGLPLPLLQVLIERALTELLRIASSVEQASVSPYPAALNARSTEFRGGPIPLLLRLEPNSKLVTSHCNSYLTSSEFTLP